MKTFKHTIITATLLCASAFSASAQVVNTDYINPGDGRIIADTETGLSFLKLTETFGRSFAQVSSELDTTYSGWRLSTAEEVTSLLTNLLKDKLNTYGGYTPYHQGASGTPIYISDTNLFNEGTIIGSQPTNVGSYDSYGMVMEGGNLLMYGFWYNEGNNSAKTHSAWGPYTEDYANTSYGIWLTQDATNISSDSNLVDVHTPIILSGLALLGFGFSRRKNRHYNKDINT
jgi:hypothetical protein